MRERLSQGGGWERFQNEERRRRSFAPLLCHLASMTDEVVQPKMMIASTAAPFLSSPVMPGGQIWRALYFGSVKRLEEDHDEVGERFLEMSEDHGEVGDGYLGDLSCVARPGHISHIEQLSGEINCLSPIHIAPNGQPMADLVLHPFLGKPVPIGTVGLVEGSGEDTDPDEMPKSTSSAASLDGKGLFVETQVGTPIYACCMRIMDLA